MKLIYLIEKNVKIYVSGDDEAPEGKKIQSGPRGGRYFLASKEFKDSFKKNKKLSKAAEKNKTSIKKDKSDDVKKKIDAFDNSLLPDNLEYDEIKTLKNYVEWPKINNIMRKKWESPNDLIDYEWLSNSRMTSAMKSKYRSKKSNEFYKAKEDAENMEKILKEKAKELTNDTTLYRGINLNKRTEDLISKIEKGKILTDRGFLSTSTDDEAAIHFGKYGISGISNTKGVVLKLIVKKGSKFLPVGAFAKENMKLTRDETDALEEQSEILLDKDSKFKVSNIYEKDGLKYIDAEQYIQESMFKLKNLIEEISLGRLIEDKNSEIKKLKDEYYSLKKKSFVSRQDLQRVEEIWRELYWKYKIELTANENEWGIDKSRKAKQKIKYKKSQRVTSFNRNRS